MNNDLVKTDNEFNGMYKKFMVNFGKGAWNKKQLERVKEVHERMKEGADKDFAKDMGGELGTPYMRFMRTNFAAIKEEEMQFRNIINFIKDKGNLFYGKGLKF